MLKAIDVSEHQGYINWEAVKGNVDFVMIRAGYGHNNIDKQFIRNISECNRLNIPVGVYWFSYAHDVEGAKAEANYVLEAIKPYKVDYPISYDLEYDTLRYASKQGYTIDKRTATDMVNAFCSTIEKSGFKAMNYANPDFINNKFYQSEISYPLWLAWYGVSEDRAKAYSPAMWQYSESGSVSGIGTNSVDMNYCYADLAEKPAPRLLATTKNVSTYLNIRAEGTADSSIVGTIPAGDEFIIKWVDSNYIGWYYIDYKGTEGFVSSDYVSKYELATTKNVSTHLNIRDKGTVDSNILGTIPAGATFSIKWVDSNYIGWYYINYNDIEGFVSSDFVQKL